jgi:hypothetical protein
MGKSRLSILLLTLLILGCANLLDAVMMEKFNQASRDYLRAIRWSEFEAANAFTETARAGKDPVDLKNLEHIKVTSYEIKQSNLSREEKEARQVVEFRYYKVDDVTIRILRDDQLWKYDPKAGGWYLQSGLPDFK